MQLSCKGAATLSCALLVGTSLVACSGSKSSGGKTPTTNDGNAVSISLSAFSSDFSAMTEFRDLAKQGKGFVGVLLPDTTTSARYVSFDAPYLQKAFQTAGFQDFKIDNAQGSATSMRTQAEADIAQGASVLIVDSLDSVSGAAIEANAVSKGVKVIDYDRLTLGGPPDRYYVSFDNVKVGALMGTGLVDCVNEWNVPRPNVLVMNGDPTDNNAALFAQGYKGVLNPLFDNATYVKVGEPAGTWTPSLAQTTFAQQYTAHPSTNAAITPNDDTANAVIAYLQSKQVQPKTFPTTGQDASESGILNILKGYQCGPV